jgi:hypothetical protein
MLDTLFLWVVGCGEVREFRECREIKENREIREISEIKEQSAFQRRASLSLNSLNSLNSLSHHLPKLPIADHTIKSLKNLHSPKNSPKINYLRNRIFLPVNFRGNFWLKIVKCRISILYIFTHR